MPLAEDSPRADVPSAVPSAEPSGERPLTRRELRLAGEAAARRTGQPSDAAATRPSVVLATLGMALLLVLSAATGPTPTGMAVAFIAVVLAWGWPSLLDAPSPRMTSLILGAGGLLIAAAAVVASSEPFLRWVPVAVAGGVIAGFFHQLVRREGRVRLAFGAATTVSGLALASAGVPFAVLPHYPVGARYVYVGGAALALTALVELLGRWATWQRWMVSITVLVAALGAIGAAAALHGIPLLAAGFLGALVAATSHAMRRVLGSLPGAGGVQARMASAAASVLVVGVVVYLIARIFSG